ncbi:MAG: hydantoinase/oxoprolinase family protein [Planctomycetota bacterium]
MQLEQMQLLGIDTGGTFTDFVKVEGGEVTVRKLPSTPERPARVILEVLPQLVGEPRASLTVVHGSTVATNTLLERRGARTALVTTRGFRDVLEIGRQDRPRIYALNWCPPEPLIPAALRFEVAERIGAGGGVLEPLQPQEVVDLLVPLREAGVEAVAVCLLFSPENDAHETLVCERLKPLGIPVIPSAQVHPEIREYERFSTTAISAYVAPAVEAYLTELAEQLHPARFLIMESGGGAMATERILGQAVRTILSGPAAGVVAAQAYSRDGCRDLVSFDMGGTSTDVSLLPQGRILNTRNFCIGGLPAAIPVVDIHSIGAGGGSLAWVDAGGALRAGPRSAGAVPGPVCYQRGGTQATVTDANLFLGRLPHDTRLGGEMSLSREGVEKSLCELGARLRLSPLEVARGILRVIEAEMERALRRVTQERGVDPRGLSLLSFGGAGGLHAVYLARALGMRQVLVPPHPGILSALGMLRAPQVETTAQAVMEELTPELLRRLAREAKKREQMCRQHLPARDDEPQVTRELSLRYRGQSHELEIPWHDGDPREDFLTAYRERYGLAEEQRPLEVTALRSRLSLPGGLPDRGSLPFAPSTSASVGRTPVFLSGANSTTLVKRVQRTGLAAGETLRGPAVIEETSSTLWLPEGAALSVAEDGCLAVDPGKSC